MHSTGKLFMNQTRATERRKKALSRHSANITNVVRPDEGGRNDSSGTAPSNGACATESSPKAHGFYLRHSSHYLSIFPKRKTFSFSYLLTSHWGKNFPSSSEKIRIRDDQIVWRQARIVKAKSFLIFCAANCEECFLALWRIKVRRFDDALTVECAGQIGERISEKTFLWKQPSRNPFFSFFSFGFVRSSQTSKPERKTVRRHTLGEGSESVRKFERENLKNNHKANLRRKNFGSIK